MRRSTLIAVPLMWTLLLCGVGFAGGRTDVAFSTFIGSLGAEQANGVAVDADGNVYVVGQTDSTSFPVLNAIQPTKAAGLDVFVAKVAADGSGLMWATYLGGNGDDTGIAIAVDPEGCAYITGRTTSLNFPTTPNAFDDDNGRMLTCTGGDCIDAFVVKFAADGQSLAYSTYLGGEHDDYAYGLAVDATGHAYITGSTNSFGYPRVNAFDPDKKLGAEAFVTKMNPTGTGVVYSSYLGGNKGDAGFAIAVDAAGNAVIVGDTASDDFLTKNPLQPNNGGGNDSNGDVDAFITALDPSGALVYSTYLGGMGRDLARGVAIDDAGAPYVVGETTSTNFPTLTPAQPTLAGGTDAFVAKVRPDGSALIWSTYAGGGRDDEATGVVVEDGRATVVGSTRSIDFPTADAVQATCGGCIAPGFFADAFVMTLAAEGNHIDFSTFLGGTAEETGDAIAAVDGGVVVAGRTYSTNFPTTPDAFQSACVCAVGNTLSAYVTRIGAPSTPVTPPTISTVTALKRPFRLQINGTNFQAGATVYIGDDATAWPTVQITNATTAIVGGGKTLKARFPKRVGVRIRIVNPDGGEATSTFTR